MLLKRSVIGIVLASVVLFSFQSSFAYTINFEKWDARIENIPTVCIIEPDYPNSEILSETFAKRLMDETRISVNEWMVQLQTSERGRDKSMWTINQMPIPLEKQEGFDYEQCTVFIKFQEKPEAQDEWYKLLGKTSYELGSTGRSDVTAYYAAIEFCKTEDKDWIYFDPCYKNYPRLMQQIKSVIKHEFGHALGLGHYVADDLDVNVAWARGIVPSPSIMAVFTHQNINQNFITTKDIQAVRSIYGDNGFLPEPEDETVFDVFQSTATEYFVPNAGYTFAGVDGIIKKDKYISGIQVEITIKDPNDSIAIRKVRVNSDGVFNFQTIVNEKTIKGTYVVYAKYLDKKSPEVTLFIGYEGISEQSKIPQWVKNSVKWWAEDKISDLDFILGVQYLIKEGILNLPSYEDKFEKTYQQNKEIGVKIPKFVKQTAGWWTEGKITDDEFVAGVQYLIKKGMLRI